MLFDKHKVHYNASTGKVHYNNGTSKVEITPPFLGYEHCPNCPPLGAPTYLSVRFNNMSVCTCIENLAAVNWQSGEDLALTSITAGPNGDGWWIIPYIGYSVQAERCEWFWTKLFPKTAQFGRILHYGSSGCEGASITRMWLSQIIIRIRKYDNGRYSLSLKLDDDFRDTNKLCFDLTHPSIWSVTWPEDLEEDTCMGITGVSNERQDCPLNTTSTFLAPLTGGTVDVRDGLMTPIFFYINDLTDEGDTDCDPFAPPGKRAKAIVTVWSQFSDPIEGATVSFSFTGIISDSDTAVTDANGQAIIYSDCTELTGNVDFEITDITHPQPYLIYSPEFDLINEITVEIT